jgi:DNA-directed RNA polymerase specialized sigma subunit
MYRDRDLELWHQWKRTQSPADLQLLLNQMSPIIHREVNKWASAVSRSLLEAEGKRLAVEAFQTYDPNRGVALATHVTTRLQKLSRLAYTTQNVARLSETKTLQFHNYNTSRHDLQERHGREPTVVELADHMGWSPKKLQDFQTQINRKEYIESEDHPDMTDAETHLVDFIYYDLTPQQQKIFEYTTGYRGSPKLSNKDIMSRMGITQGQLSYQKNLIVQTVERIRTRHG